MTQRVKSHHRDESACQWEQKGHAFQCKMQEWFSCSVFSFPPFNHQSLNVLLCNSLGAWGHRNLCTTTESLLLINQPSQRYADGVVQAGACSTFSIFNVFLILFIVTATTAATIFCLVFFVAVFCAMYCKCKWYSPLFWKAPTHSHSLLPTLWKTAALCKLSLVLVTGIMRLTRTIFRDALLGKKEILNLM